MLTKEVVQECTKRLIRSRIRILDKHGFYGLLLMHAGLALNEEMPTAATDGDKIYFSPAFMETLSDSELDFVMMHEIMHIVLQHCNRGNDFDDHERFNIACDIVVNSNICKSNNNNLNSISINGKPSMHLTPNKEEGFKFTAEEVYEMLTSPLHQNPKSVPLPGSSKAGKNGRFDDHSKWSENANNEALRDKWITHAIEATEIISIQNPTNQWGNMPLFAKRLLDKLRDAQLDWKAILNSFIQEEVCDYSFSPPDRRFDDSPFFLPDYNDTDETVKDILFMIDTSGSMTDDMINAAYSEIKGAIDQYNGRLRGWLGFFDAAIIEPKPFSEKDTLDIKVAPGGGGTDFQIIFEYVNENMNDPVPSAIIILTDGKCFYPNESIANGIPILWIINNEDVTPPWGKVVRIK